MRCFSGISTVTSGLPFALKVYEFHEMTSGFAKVLMEVGVILVVVAG